MAETEKVSVSLGASELRWARERAERDHLSLSAVVTDAVRLAAQLEARREVSGYLAEGQPPITEEELQAVRAEWKE